MDYVIPVSGNLTSYVFYEDVIRLLHAYFVEERDDQVVFDFSCAKTIDPLVLPNLLCAGYWIARHREHPARIFVPGSPDFSPLRTFLNRTRFVELAQKYNLFQFDDCISGGLKESKFRTTLNKLEVFQSILTPDGAINVPDTREREWNRLKESFLPFIREFLQYSTEAYVKENKNEISVALLSFCREVIENSLFHGLSFCFLNMQYSAAYGKQIKISISDCGRGFKNAINADRNRALHISELQKMLFEPSPNSDQNRLRKEMDRLKDMCYPLCQTEDSDDIQRLINYPVIQNELEGIIYGLLARKTKPYGLYNIHNRIINAMGGTIRVHSNDTQLILSQRMWMPLATSSSPASLLEQLSGKEYEKNLRTGLKFKGVHIEMDVQLEYRREDGI